jgi:hypothetical protein
MAKRRRNMSRDVQHPSAADGTTLLTPRAEATLSRAEGKIVDFAEDLGRLLGTAQRKASEWMGQRKAVVQQLQEIRSTADELLRQLTDRAQSAVGISGRAADLPARRSAPCLLRRGNESPLPSADDGPR